MSDAVDQELASMYSMTFRITAVRRRSWLIGRILGHVTPVADEEIIQALWERRAKFETRLAHQLRRELPGVVGAIKDLRTGTSVLATIAFTHRGDSSLATKVNTLAEAVTIAAASVLATGMSGAAVAAIPVSSSQEASQSPSAEAHQESDTKPWGVVGPVLGAIASGLGVIGFATLVGGVILWARLDAAGFPAESALSVAPSQDLLVIGAVTLIPEVLVALACVAALVLFTALLDLGQRRRRKGPLFKRLRDRTEVVVALVLFVGLLGALALQVKRASSGGEIVGLFVVAVTLTAIIGWVVHITPSFVYRAVAVFVAVGVFLTFLAYARAHDSDEARGAVIIRQNKKAIVGFFVAEGAQRVYLARVSIPGKTVVESESRLIGISKDQISDIAVGDSKTPSLALLQGRALARELCALEPSPSPPAGGEGQSAQENCWTAPPGQHQP